MASTKDSQINNENKVKAGPHPTIRYGINFLLLFRDRPECQTRPEGLPEDFQPTPPKNKKLNKPT